ncbi:hypothetical protein OG225_40795 (plasmid) [Nocardia sp. NBC_01377]|uniref:DUF6372 family protein n=1 Tax=Nocardia sp. NBC_01377 TaxID=2903595 RepID=UPI002F91B979
MTGDAVPAPILAVRVPVAMAWTQHARGGCRCLCGIYHRGVGTGGCLNAAEPGLLITLEVTDDPADAPRVPGADGPLPVCAWCYHLLAVPDTPASILREALDATITRRGTRCEAAAVALLADTGLLGHLGVRRHVVDDLDADDTGNRERVVRVQWSALADDPEHLTLDLSQECVLALALSLACGEPVDLADVLSDLDPRHRRPVADALTLALGLTDTTTRPRTPIDPGDPR